jgi:hypothetical protein
LSELGFIGFEDEKDLLLLPEPAFCHPEPVEGRSKISFLSELGFIGFKDEKDLLRAF